MLYSVPENLRNRMGGIFVILESPQHRSNKRYLAAGREWGAQRGWGSWWGSRVISRKQESLGAEEEWKGPTTNFAFEFMSHFPNSGRPCTVSLFLKFSWRLSPALYYRDTKSLSYDETQVEFSICELIIQQWRFQTCANKLFQMYFVLWSPHLYLYDWLNDWMVFWY